MRITKENIKLLETVTNKCNSMELSENESYYFMTLHGVEECNILVIADNAKYYKASVFYSYSYNLKTKDMILTFKKIEN